jgi:sugar lactone lactonase YvrE
MQVLFAGDALAQVAPSTFSPLTGDGSCFVQPGRGTAADACPAASGLTGAGDVAVSPDQRNVYVTAATSNALVTFARDEAGRLTPAGCISDGLCQNGDGLRGAARVAVAPDGKFVYVISTRSNSLTWFARDTATGALTQSGCLSWNPLGSRCAGAFGLPMPSDLALSEDGSRLYVTSSFESSITEFALDPDTGVVGWAGCVSSSGSDGACADGTGMESPRGVAVAPGSGTVYLASDGADALAWFARSGAAGALEQRGCLREAPIAGGSCTVGRDVADVYDLAISPDGADAYGVRASTIVHYRRGADESLEPADCVRHAPPAGDDMVVQEDPDDDEEDEDEDEEDAEDAAVFATTCAPAKALEGAGRLSITPDGRTLVASGYGSMAVFAREAGGTLRQLACAEAYATYRSCLTIPGIGAPAISPDGKTMYVSGSDGVRAFTLAAAPAGTTAHVSRSGVAAVRVGCPKPKRRACAVRVRLGARAANRARRPMRLAPGEYRTIAARIPRAARRALRRHRAPSVVVRVRDVSTRTAAAKGRVALRARIVTNGRRRW